MLVTGNMDTGLHSKLCFQEVEGRKGACEVPDTLLIEASTMYLSTLNFLNDKLTVP